MRLVITGAVLALALAAGCAKQEAPKPPPPRAVDVLELQPSEVRETGEYLGSLMTRQSVSVLPQVAGYVRRIHVKPGQRVQAGATLVEVDAREESAALESAQAQHRSAQATLDLAKQTAKRSESLYGEGLLSAQELERARAQAEASEASVTAAEAQVSQRRVKLQYFAVRAPFAGVAGDVTVRLGDFVSPTTPLTTIAQADVLEVSVAVPAERARTLNKQTPVEILNDKGEVVVRTQVFFVAPEANARTQLVDVKAVFENTVHLRPSELVRVRLVYSTRPALQVPALAVVRQSGQAFVYGVKQGEAGPVVERRPITLGALGASAYVVEGGLETGDRIAVSSIQALKDGARIEPKAPAAARAGTGTVQTPAPN